MRYFATKQVMAQKRPVIGKIPSHIKAIQNEQELQSYIDDGYSIIAKDNDTTTILYENGEWFGDRPVITGQSEPTSFQMPDISAQIRQNSADVAYISMMTGVDL